MLGGGGGGGTMLFRPFRVICTVKELDSHAKHGQSFKKLFGSMTEYFCAKNLPSRFVQVPESFFQSWLLLTKTMVELLIWAFLPKECARARIDWSESKSAPINELHLAARDLLEKNVSKEVCFWL